MKKATSSSNTRRKTTAGKVTPKKTAAAKKPAAKKAPAKKTAKPAAKLPAIPASGTLAARVAAAKKIEAQDRPKAAARTAAAKAPASHPQRISSFPGTYIAEISVRLEDPDHPVTLRWTGPQAAAQETGPFRSSPGAGLRGLNCDNVATSRRSGSTCTPKGTFTVTGFAPHLNSHPEATNVTWFVPARGIALHYYPSVPKFAASHGCVRIQSRRVAQLLQDNSRAGITKVVVDGTWTKPPHQW
ncbi:MAG: L,D-transpeptidase [Chthoniobacter sp.]|nr:L,D-transpeptidase [Chthoniobacter sp.]